MTIASPLSSLHIARRPRPTAVARVCLFALAVGQFVAGDAAFAQSSMQINVNQSLGAVGVSRDEAGRRVTFVCPAGNGKTLGTIYGTDVYTDSSPICPAAIHAGVLTAGKAGVVTLVLGAGGESFPGSKRNGVTSVSYGRYGYSYTFARDGAPGSIGWRTTWNWNERPTIALTEPIAVVCPAGGKTNAVIYGTDVYSLDSAICVAAVHAGAITAERGGIVAVTRVPAVSEDPGSERFGIASRRRNAAVAAYTVMAGTSQAPLSPGPTPTTSSTIQTGTASGAPVLGGAAGTFAAARAATSSFPQPRTITAGGFAGAGAYGVPPARTINTPVGFTASGALYPPRRKIIATGFTGQGQGK